MALAVGDRLGPYEIIAAIGAGGMGEVWKARDTRLDRIVAIKRLRKLKAPDSNRKLASLRPSTILTSVKSTTWDRTIW
jgi:serine/threonine protein kinase